MKPFIHPVGIYKGLTTLQNRKLPRWLPPSQLKARYMRTTKVVELSVHTSINFLCRDVRHYRPSHIFRVAGGPKTRGSRQYRWVLRLIQTV